MRDEVRFAAITDVHLGKDNSFNKGRTLGAKAPSLLKEFVKEMNDRFKPDFIVSLGDMIREESRELDKRLLRRYRKQLSALKAPVYFVIGNHDVKHLTDKEIKIALGLKRFYYVFDVGHLRFVVLYSFARYSSAKKKVLSHGRFMMPVIILNRQLGWLKSTLKKSRKPVVVFNHYPLDEQDLRTNPYAKFFHSLPWRAAVNNRASVRKILQTSMNVLAVFTGHLHWRKKNRIRDIHYYSIPSLTEVKHGAWAEVTLRGKNMSVQLKRVGI